MSMEQVQKHRRARLLEAADKAGGKAALGRLLGYRDGAFVGQMLRGERPVTEDTVLKLETKRGFRGWFSAAVDSGTSPALLAEMALSERDLDLVKALHELPANEQDEVYNHVMARAETERYRKRLATGPGDSKSAGSHSPARKPAAKKRVKV